MSIWDGIRRLAGRARTGASDMARVANIRLDLRNLEGRRDHLLRSIGERALALRAEGRGVRAFETVCAQVEEVDRAIAARRTELTRVHAEGDPAREATV